MAMRTQLVRLARARAAHFSSSSKPLGEVPLKDGVRGALSSLSPLGADSVAASPAFLTQPKTVEVIGAPMQWGQPHLGTDDSPQRLRDAGLRSVVAKQGWRLADAGDVDMTFSDLTQGCIDRGVDPHAAVAGALHCPLVGEANRRLAELVQSAASGGKFVLTLGGDHSIGCGTLAGILSARPDVGVIWIDAHADINTPATSGSGNLHGMPVAQVMKLPGTDNLPGFEWLQHVPKLHPAQVAYIGLRDLDDGERVTLTAMRKQGMYVSTMQDVDAFGIGQVVRNALASLGDHRPLHLSYDIDALDPVVAPATGTLVRGGLTFRESHYIAEAVAETGRLCGMDMVEVNAMLGKDESEKDRTTEMAMVLMASALGSRIL